ACARRLCDPARSSRLTGRARPCARSGLEQARTRVSIQGLRQRLDCLLLLGVEPLRHVNHEAVVKVTARRRAAAELRRSLAAQALERAHSAAAMARRTGLLNDRARSAAPRARL